MFDMIPTNVKQPKLPKKIPAINAAAAQGLNANRDAETHQEYLTRIGILP